MSSTETVFSPALLDVVEVYRHSQRDWVKATVKGLPSTGNTRYLVEYIDGGTDRVVIWDMRPFEPPVIEAPTRAATADEWTDSDTPVTNIEPEMTMVRHEHALADYPVRNAARERLTADLLRMLVRGEVDPETPGRMARALEDLVSGYGTNLGSLLKTFDVTGEQGIVLVRDVPFASLCEHHVLPFTGTASVAYIPQGKIVGLSKIPRLVKALSRRLQVQERLGAEIGRAMWEHLNPKGVMVVLRGRHSCMAIRGIESPGEMVTSFVLGAFAQDASARAEALSLMR